MVQHPERDAPVVCAHCGEPAHRQQPDAQGNVFCCSGCAAVYQILESEGLKEYYTLRDAFAGRSGPVIPENRAYVEFDAEVPAPDTAGRVVSSIVVPDMHCGACVWLLEKMLLREEGVQQASVDLTNRCVELAWNPDTTRLSTIAGRIARLGYRPQVQRQRSMQQLRQRESRREWIRLGVAGALAGNLMLLSVPLHAAQWYGISQTFGDLFRYVSWLLATPLALYAAAPFHRRAWGALRHGALHIDLPLSLGILVAYVGSAMATVAGYPDVYFDSLGGLVFLLLVGRQVQRSGYHRAEQAAEQLVLMGTPYAMRLDPYTGGFEEIPSDQLRPGDLIEVGTASPLPADGEIARGRTYLNEGLLTGESVPVSVSVGDKVAAGCTNLGPPVRVRVTAAGADTRLAELARLLREAGRQRAPVIDLTDRLAVWFTAATLVASTATFVYWLSAGVPAALSAAVAVAVVLCPCALGLATPLSLAVAQGRAATKGMMIKGVAGVQRLAEVRTAVFDKTGTLTRGVPEVVAWHGLLQHDGLDLRDLVASLEVHALHPAATALRGYGVPRYSATGIVQVAGKGIGGDVAGHRLRIGAEHWFEAGHIAPGLRRVKDTGSKIYIELNASVVAVAVLADALHDTAAAGIADLRRQQITPMLVSGDQAQVVAEVADAVGIETWVARADPEEKLRLVQQFPGPVVMVGDGANDAAAMAAAHAGVAVSGGVEAALSAADAYLLRPGIGDIAALVDICRRAMRVIRRNIALGAVYNVVGLGLAATGTIGPLGAVLLMPASSLTVTLSSYLQGKTRSGL